MEDYKEFELLKNKSAHSLTLYEHFVSVYKTIGQVEARPTKSMIAIRNDRKNIAWVTALGKNFLHVVFPFSKAYPDNFCFQKIAQVPGDAHQFNHHLRILFKDDINEEVKGFMKLAYEA